MLFGLWEQRQLEWSSLLRTTPWRSEVAVCAGCPTMMFVVQDNGVKIADPMGELLAQEWEGHATKLANIR